MKVMHAAVLVLTLLTGTIDAQRARAPQTPQPPPVNSPAAPAAAKTAVPPTGVVNLSAGDVALLISELGLPSDARARLASSAEERRAFAKNLRETFALAMEGRGAGLAASAEIKLQLELARAFVVARVYTRKREAQGATPNQIVSDAEVSALLAEPGQAARVEQFLQDYQRNRPEAQRATPITTEERAYLLQRWARVMVADRKGVAAGVDKQRGTELMIGYQQAQLLASRYFTDTLAARTKPTAAEVNAYLADHPELDTSKERAKAEEILRRARVGEDFGKLADEFTTDPSGKGRGGDLGWFGRGVMVKPFEDAVFALKPGELASVIETQLGFHVIKLEERRTTKDASGADTQEVRARHILIGTQTQGKSLQQIAREALERMKRERVIAEIVARSGVMIAEDFRADPPPP